MIALAVGNLYNFQPKAENQGFREDQIRCDSEQMQRQWGYWCWWWLCMCITIGSTSVYLLLAHSTTSHARDDFAQGTHFRTICWRLIGTALMVGGLQEFMLLGICFCPRQQFVCIMGWRYNLTTCVSCARCCVCAPKILPWRFPRYGILFDIQCFEGMKAYHGVDGQVRLFRPNLNVKRFNKSCARLAMPTVEPEDFIKWYGFELLSIVCVLLRCWLWCVGWYVSLGQIRWESPSDGMWVELRIPSRAALHTSAFCWYALNSLTSLVNVDRDWIPHERGMSLYIRPTMIATTPLLGVAPPSDARMFVILSPAGAYYDEGFKPIRILADTTHCRAWPGGIGIVVHLINICIHVTVCTCILYLCVCVSVTDCIATDRIVYLIYFLVFCMYIPVLVVDWNSRCRGCKSRWQLRANDCSTGVVWMHCGDVSIFARSESFPSICWLRLISKSIHRQL